MKKDKYIFVVDDDQSARRGLARLLRAAGHNVQEYASANEFLDIITTDDSGCLVLDARIPGMSGDELNAELIRRGIDLSIIVVTGDDDPEMKRDKYIEYRLDNQIDWYNNKASHNQKRSALWFIAGLSLLGIGAILTIGVIVGYLPNWSFLGFFTTVSVSISSWFQAKRNDELKITYSVTAQELLRFRDRLKLTSDEAELGKLVEYTEKAISREHKLWLTRLMGFI